MNKNDNQIEPDIVVEGSNNWVVVEGNESDAAVVLTNDLTLKSQDAVPFRTGHAATTATVTTTMTSTASASGGGGLSELSKQLRMLQNKNQNQSIEIDKLHRQLRILSELQNVHVNDIRSALEIACQAEAYGELQNRITSLREELEVIQLTAATSKSTLNPAKTVSSTPLGNIPSPEEMQNGQIIANLELRIGEMEEMDEQRRNEIKQLYVQLQNHQGESSQWQSKCDQLRNENEQLQLQLTKYQQEKQKKLNEVPGVEISAVAVVDDNSRHNITKDEIQKLQAANIIAMAQVRDAETWANMVTEKLKLCEQQRDAIEKELNLRNVQYKARYLVQEENMNDLRQQLMSLYTAYDFVKEEKERDDITRNQLQALLGHADAEVARQVGEMDHQSPRGSSYISTTPTTPSSMNQKLSMSYSTQTRHVVPPESPIPMTDRSLSSTSSSLLMQRQPLQESAPIMSGELLIKDTRGVLKKWRKRHVKLYATVSHFHLDVEEEKGYAIQIGISSVEIYPKYPYGMSIYMGKRSGLSLIVAATNDKDFQEWMTVLTYATTGTEIDVNDDIVSIETPSSMPTKSSYDIQQSQRRMGQQQYPPTLQEQQASDLELALELSEREFQWSQQRHLS